MVCSSSPSPRCCRSLERRAQAETTAANVTARPRACPRSCASRAATDVDRHGRVDTLHGQRRGHRLFHLRRSGAASPTAAARRIRRPRSSSPISRAVRPSRSPCSPSTTRATGRTRATMTVSAAPCRDISPPSMPTNFRQAATTRRRRCPRVDPASRQRRRRRLRRLPERLQTNYVNEHLGPVAGLACGSTTQVQVDAVDAAGNHSDRATSVGLQAAACGDTSAPRRRRTCPSPRRPRPASRSVGTRPATTSASPGTASPSPDGPRSTSPGRRPRHRPDLQHGVHRDRRRVRRRRQPLVRGLDDRDHERVRVIAATVRHDTALAADRPVGHGRDVRQPHVQVDGPPPTTSASTGYDLSETAPAGPRSPSRGRRRRSRASPATRATPSRSTLYDAAGNRSAPTAVTASTSACSRDAAASAGRHARRPSQPSGLAVSAATATSAALAWNASTDNVGVTGYRTSTRDRCAPVDRDADHCRRLGSHAVARRTPFAVDAFDAAGNHSTQRLGHRLDARLPRHAGSDAADERRRELAHGDEHRPHLVGLHGQRRRRPGTASTAGRRSSARERDDRDLLRPDLQHELHARRRRVRRRRQPLDQDDRHGRDHGLRRHDAAHDADRPAASSVTPDEPHADVERSRPTTSA